MERLHHRPARPRRNHVRAHRPQRLCPKSSSPRRPSCPALAIRRPLQYNRRMTREHVVTAKREGIPFEINMAGAKSYRVADAEHIMIGQTAVIVMDDKDCPHVLPLLTMTGLSYLTANGG